jgi:hypothetical protein
MANLSANQQRRYCVANSQWVQAAILPRDLNLSGNIPAQLREISQVTAIVLVSGPPELRYQCRVEITSPRFRPSLMLASEIHWARPNSAGDWLLGCRFDAPIDQATFREVVESGVLNRRSSVRERSRIPVEVQLQPSKNRVAATVSDFSEGGICLTLSGSSAAESTRHLCIYGVIDGQEVRLSVKIRWSLSVGPNRLVGCQFARESDYLILRKLHLATHNEVLDVLRPATASAST